MTSPSTNLAISASAGTGKTFALAHRYISLLAYGVPPERILAMTFTRKAAGEIFDEIIGYLTRYAADGKEGDICQDSGNISAPQRLTQNDFSKMLCTLLDAMPRLRISTLDSFLVAMIRLFAMEFGLDGEIRLMDGKSAEARRLKQNTFDGLMASLDTQASAIFLEAFKQATFGVETKHIQARMDELLEDGSHFFRLFPAQNQWTASGFRTTDTHKLPTNDRARIASGIRDWTAKDAQKIQDAVNKTLAILEAIETPRMPLPDGAFWKQLVEQYRDLPACQLRYRNKTYDLTPVGHQLKQLLDHLLAIEWGGSASASAGMWHVMDQYLKVYEQKVRRKGFLTFTDILDVVTRANPANMDIDNIYYRLDARWDHWLLDEFQDTSRQQWHSLEPLAVEVIQDNPGGRTFFLVGDPKQAIYSFRGGESGLFNEIVEKYQIAPQPLDESHRSVPAIIDTVNLIFAGPMEGIHPGAARMWHALWKPHSSASRIQNAPGCCRLLHLPEQDGQKPEAKDRYKIAAALVADMKKSNPRLEIAVLARTGNETQAIAEVLRKECPILSIILEGNCALRDNLPVEVLYALVRWATHPADMAARRIVQMSPLLDIMAAPGIPETRWPEKLLRQMMTNGFEPFLHGWGNELRARAGFNDFENQRFEQLLTAATAFDMSGMCQPDRFLAHLDAWQFKDMATGSSVRVMTVHQAKGLGFDAVILPELQSHHENLVRIKETPLLFAGPPGTDPQRVTVVPRRDLIPLDPAIRGIYHHIDAHGVMDELCIFYVAMTRARYGLYLITSDWGNSSETPTRAKLLHTALKQDTLWPDHEAGGFTVRCKYSNGDPTWFKLELTTAPAPAKVASAPTAVCNPVRARLLRRRPSEEPDTNQPAAVFFKPATAATFGIAFHALMAGLEWADHTSIDDLIQAWSARFRPEASLKTAARATLENLFTHATIKATLSRPSSNAGVWREKSFEIILNGVWVSGCFDRVTIEYTPDGKTLRAVILDYKTNEPPQTGGWDTLALNYQSQMEIYRRALSQMINIREEAVHMEILFTKGPCLIRMPPQAANA